MCCKACVKDLRFNYANYLHALSNKIYKINKFEKFVEELLPNTSNEINEERREN